MTENTEKDNLTAERQELSDSEIRYRRLFEAARDGILILDAETLKITDVNPYMMEFQGYSREEFIGKEVWEIGIFGDKKENQAAFQELLKTGYIRYEDMQLKTKKGESWDVEFVCNVYKEGVRQVIQCNIRDITARKQTEDKQRQLTEDLEMERKRLVKAQALAKVGSWELDLRTNVLKWSEENYRIFGIDRTEFGESYEAFLELLHPDDRSMVNKAYTESVANRTPLAIDHRLPSKDGGFKFVHERCLTFYDEDGKPLRSVGTTQDITERKLAEEEINFQAHLLNTVEQAVIATNLNLEVIYWNQFAEKLYGWLAEEAIGHNIFELNTPESSVEDAHAIIAHLKSKNSWAGEFEVHHKNGKVFCAHVTNSPIYNDKGVCIGIVGVSMDITERKRIENALRQSEEQYRIIAETATDAIISIDEKSTILFVNKSTARIFGYENEQMLGQNLNMLIPEHLREAHKIGQERYIKTGEKHLHWELVDVSGLHRDGHEIPLALSFGEYKKDNQHIFIGIARDISERKRFEESLRQAEASYRNLVELSPAIVYLAKPVHPYEPIYVSPNISKFGYPADEWFSRNDMWISLIHEEDRERVLRLTGDAMDRNLETDLEYRIIARDGSTHWVHDKGCFVSDEQGNKIGWQGVIVDVTETKQLEEQLRQSQKLESIGRLAGGIAHDFNNMLTAINGYSELTLRRMKEDDPLRGYIEEIKKAGERSAELTHQLLAFSRQQVLKPKLINLNDVVEETSNMLQRMLGEDIQFVTVINPKLGTVMADFGQLSQIIMNLTVNARDAMPRGGKLTIETKNVFLDPNYTSRHAGVLPGAYVMLAVSDTGIGMSEEIQRHVFEPFFTTKDVGQGTGLGLATVYGIVKQSRGNIEIYSEEAVGTTFKIYLPRVVGQAELESAEENEKEIMPATETILLVEDEDIVRALAKQVLENYGYTVIEARNGLEALTVCEAEDCDFDLLMTDVVMPQMGGRELADSLREKLPDLPVLFTSGYTDDAVVRHGVIEVGTNFIQKPFTPDALAKKVRELLSAAEKKNE